MSKAEIDEAGGVAARSWTGTEGVWGGPEPQRREWTGDVLEGVDLAAILLVKGKVHAERAQVAAFRGPCVLDVPVSGARGKLWQTWCKETYVKAK